MAEIRREQFTHTGRPYAIVVTDDGRHLQAIATSGERAIRKTRIEVPRDGVVGLEGKGIDRLIDDVKQKLYQLRPDRSAVRR